MVIDTVTAAVVHSHMPVFQLTDQIIFPYPELAEENGLLAVGGDLKPQRLVEAYRQGIFPWYSENDPILWWFTSPRLIIFPEELRVSRRLARYFRNSRLSFSINKAFQEVITSCAINRTSQGEETWITEEMLAAYINLHHLNFSHSVECWENDKLVGGLYGVALGKVFFGESMFSNTANASKFALMYLVDFLTQNDYKLIDCQMTTTHLVSLGAREIPGKAFQHLLKQHIKTTTSDGAWPHEENA
jgi:leucyl/phenylalanyl-tRNA--protein transferase